MREKSDTSYATARLAQKAAKGGGITIVGNGLGRALSLGLHVLLARVLGSSSYGLYALGLGVIQLAKQVSILGFNRGSMRFVSQYHGEADVQRVKGTIILSLSFPALASAVLGTLLFLSANAISTGVFKEPSLAPVLRVLSLALPFFVITDIAVQCARGFQRMGYYVGIGRVLRPAVHAILVSFVFLLGHRLMGVTYALLLTAVVTAMIGLQGIRRMFPEGRSTRPIYETQRLLRFSLTVLLLSLSQSFLSHTDKFMIGYFMTSAHVGVYSAAARAAKEQRLFIASLNAIFSPMVADLYNRNRLDELEELFKRVTRWAVTMTLPLFLMFVLFPAKIISIFGADFVGGSSVLAVLCGAYLIDVATGTVGALLVMTGRQKVELLNVISTGVINMGLNVWLIQRYGILGAAMGTGLSIAIVNIVKIVEVYKLLGIHPYDRKYLKPLIAGCMTILLTRLLMTLEVMNSYWVVALLACPIIYLIIVYVLGLEDEDVLLLKAAMSRLKSALKRR
ncbi:flippase [Candidatus Bipolaricaulota bacterium]